MYRPLRRLLKYGSMGEKGWGGMGRDPGTPSCVI